MIRSRLFRVAAIAAFAVASVSVSAAMTPQTAPPPPSSPEPTRPTRTNPPPPAPVSDDLVREVIDRIKALGAVAVRKMDGIEETVKFPLPKGLKLD